jgi:hypothetical protein
MAMTIVEADRPVTGGVDTHLDVHVAAALDSTGGLLGVESFPASPAGCVCCVSRHLYGSHTILGLFHEAAPDLSDRATFIELVRGYLAGHQELIETCQGYSYDKRSSPSPYLDGTEVGFFSGKRNSVTHHGQPLDACADLIYRESLWVLDRQGGG